MSITAQNVSPGGKQRTIALDAARWRLAVIWFPSCGLIFLIIIAQSLGGAYGEELQRAWSWALPNFLPTLALMLSVFAADALRPANESETFVRYNFALLAMGLSLFYIAVLLLSLLAQPIFGSHADATNPVLARLELLEISNLWLAPLQSLVVASIGVLFFLKEGEAKQGGMTGG